jgi:hypothetical protein
MRAPGINPDAHTYCSISCNLGYMPDSGWFGFFFLVEHY